MEGLAEAHVLALEYLKNGGESDCFNIGTSEGSTVKEVLSACERAVGSRIGWTAAPAVLLADNGKARKKLGWPPERTLEDSVRAAYAWELRRSSDRYDL